MMRSSVWLLAWLLLSGVPARGDELLVNGDFEEPVDVGWLQEVDGGTIYRATTYHPDDDYEIWVYKGTGSGYARLSQEVSIPGTDATFRASLQPSASATSEAWAAAGLRVAYLDESGVQLGETLVGVVTQHCPWENSPTYHLIEADPGIWQECGFRIDEELAHLPGVAAAAVRGLRVTVLAHVYNC